MKNYPLISEMRIFIPILQMKELNIEALCASPHNWEKMAWRFGVELKPRSPNSRGSKKG